MMALVYGGPGEMAWEKVPKPVEVADTDVIVRVDVTTICGTDLHILKGDLPAVTAGRILGHEAVGTVDSVGSGVKTLEAGDRVLVSCVSACGTCRFCREHRYGQCLGGGGGILGNTIDGTQVEYVRVPFADTSTYPVPEGVSDEELLMLVEILPTGYEVGVLNGGVQPGDVVAVVGAGPIGLSAMMGARLFSPSHVVAIDLVDSRLEAATSFGADRVVNNGRDDPKAMIDELTDGLGADVSIEAVGCPPPSSWRPACFGRGDGSPTSAYMAPRSPCTSRTCGPATSRSPPGWSTPSPSRCCSACCEATRSTPASSPPTTSRSNRSKLPTTPSRVPARPAP